MRKLRIQRDPASVYVRDASGKVISTTPRKYKLSMKDFFNTRANKGMTKHYMLLGLPFVIRYF